MLIAPLGDSDNRWKDAEGLKLIHISYKRLQSSGHAPAPLGTSLALGNKAT